MTTSRTKPLDDKDAAILAARIERWEARTGPRVGDFCIWPGGWLERFSYHWDTEKGLLQTARGGSFHISRDGYASFSGGLEPPVMIERLRELPEQRPGAFWFFSHDIPRGGGGVEVFMPCRVYRVLAPDCILHDTPTGWPGGLWEAAYFRDVENCGSYLTPSEEEARRVSTHWYMTGKAGLDQLEVLNVSPKAIAQAPGARPIREA